MNTLRACMRMGILLSCLLFTPIILQGQQKFSYELRSDLSFAERVELGETFYQNRTKSRGNGYKQFQRWKYWNSRELDRNGKIISAEQITQEIAAFHDTKSSRSAISGSFTELGPKSATNTSTWSSHLGRLTGIAVQHNSFNHIIVSAPSGGVWKTTNGGTTWTALFDDMPMMNIYSIEMSHGNTNHYFVGTDGSGMYRSTNGGTSWTQVSGIDIDDRIIDIKMHPSNASILYACGERKNKLYRSSDGGANWLSADLGVPVYDVEFKPGDPTLVYIGIQGAALVFDEDLGQIFSLGSFPLTGAGAVMLAVTPANPNYLYALAEINGGLHGVYLSTNSGLTFTSRITNQFGGNNILGIDITKSDGQAPRDMDIAVSPVNAGVVHVGGIETWKSNDFGSNWFPTSDWLIEGNLPFIHADIDQLQYVSIGNTHRLYAATDGGIFYSDNHAVSFTDITQGIGTRQFYRIGASKTSIDRVSGGSQDNGAGIYKGNQWYDWLGADGMETFIDKSNANIVYGMTQNGTLYKSIDGANTHFNISGPANDNVGAWVTPLEQDPNSANTVYVGFSQLYKSVNSGAWQKISNFSHIGNDNKLREVKIAPSNSSVIYAAFQGSMYKTTNGGSNWNPISFPTSFFQINFITVHPANPNRLIVALSGATNGAKFLESTNGGSNWSNISSNLPNIGAECALYEGDNLDGIYVGMNPGIYYKNNSTGGNWSNAGNNLPNVKVTELEIQNNTLYVATYGRGLWKASLSSNLVYTWTGSSSSNWMSGSNWQGGEVPGQNDLVIIPNTSRDPVINNGQHAQVSSISIENNAKLTVKNGGRLTTRNTILTVSTNGEIIAEKGSIITVDQ